MRPVSDVRSMGTGGKLVELSDITRVFRTADGEVQALDRIAFEVRTGEFLSVVGPSGCGKSTHVMLIAGLLAPTPSADLRRDLDENAEPVSYRRVLRL